MNKKLILPTIALSACFLASCGGGSKHKVSFIGNNYKIDNKLAKDFTLEVSKNAKIGVIKNIKADTGYELPTSITIDAFSSGYVWDKTNGSIDFKDLVMPDKDVKITIVPTAIAGYRTVTFTGGHYTIDRTATGTLSIKVGQKIGVFELETSSDYYQFEEDGATITPFPHLDYSYTIVDYDQTYATLDFKETVMPDLDITINIVTSSL